jgi:hypothetical protein
MVAFWGIALCSLWVVWRFRGAYCLNLQDLSTRRRENLKYHLFYIVLFYFAVLCEYGAKPPVVAPQSQFILFYSFVLETTTQWLGIFS